MNKQSINRLSQQKLKRRPPASFLPDGPLDHAADLAATVWAAISAGTPPAAALATSLDTAASLGVSPSAAETAALAAAVSAATLPSSAELAAALAAAVSATELAAAEPAAVAAGVSTAGRFESLAPELQAAVVNSLPPMAMLAVNCVRAFRPLDGVTTGCLALARAAGTLQRYVRGWLGRVWLAKSSRWFRYRAQTYPAVASKRVEHDTWQAGLAPDFFYKQFLRARYRNARAAYP